MTCARMAVTATPVLKRTERWLIAKLLSLRCGGGGGGSGPAEPRGGKDPVEQEDAGRQRDQRDVERRPHLHEEREPVREAGNRQREDEAAEARVGRRARVRDHEEGEDQQR